MQRALQRHGTNEWFRAVAVTMSLLPPANAETLVRARARSCSWFPCILLGIMVQLSTHVCLRSDLNSETHFSSWRRTSLRRVRDFSNEKYTYCQRNENRPIDILQSGSLTDISLVRWKYYLITGQCCVNETFYFQSFSFYLHYFILSF